MIDFKEILSKILNGSISLDEISSVAIFLKIEEPDFEKKKLLVKREVLLQLMRENVTEDLKKQLKQTEDQLMLRFLGKQSGYCCCFIGCSYKTKRHRDYVSQRAAIRGEQSRHCRCYQDLWQRVDQSCAGLLLVYSPSSQSVPSCLKWNRVAAKN